MLLRNLSELPALLQPTQALLGLDYGSVVIGVAVSDPGLRVASPVASITRKKFAGDAATLMKLIRERNIGALVVGLPKNMDGSEGGSAQAVRAFLRNLAAYRENGELALSQDFPAALWDERLSTAAVERFLISNDISRKRRDEVVDKTAAAYILQGALDNLYHTGAISGRR